MSAQATDELAQAYAACREIAKREAKNFYYAFRVLPQHKSDAMCAVYAFMRKADDLADNEDLPLYQRRAAMAEWTDAWRASRSHPTHDPVFVALNDTQQRFNIGDDLLDHLVAGTTLDLEEDIPGVTRLDSTTITDQGRTTDTFNVYQTFPDLYRYCYLVASVVGLVCIRIFGYTDPRAEKLAEHVGIAFQLTNILRDIKEDAQRGRVYLPLDDMTSFHIDVERLVLSTRGVAPGEEIVALLRYEIQRAQVYYLDAEELIPLLDADAQPAMRVLTTIYGGLLERIAADPTAVFRKRVSVPLARKLAILARGMAATLRARGRK